MSCSDIRARARQILAGKWGMAVLVTLIASILGGALASSAVNYKIDVDEDVIERFPQIMKVYLAVVASTAGTLSMVRFVIGGVVKLGYCRYLLKLHDGEEGELSDLFSQFKQRFLDGFLLELLTSIYIFLWTLLFIIPGIVAGYKYAMAPFILLENPGMKPNEAITASKEMMDGHKGELFTLDLSFIGWSILCLLTAGIGTLWLNPYMNVAHTVFYRDLCPQPAATEQPEVLFPIPPVEA